MNVGFQGFKVLFLFSSGENTKDSLCGIHYQITNEQDRHVWTNLYKKIQAFTLQAYCVVIVITFTDVQGVESLLDKYNSVRNALLKELVAKIDALPIYIPYHDVT